MATLHIRNVPDDLDAALTADAKAHGRSKNKRAIELLQRGLGLDMEARRRLVAEIRANAVSVDVDVGEFIRSGRPSDD